MAVFCTKDVKLATCFQVMNRNASEHQISTTGTIYSIFATISNIYTFKYHINYNK